MMDSNKHSMPNLPPPQSILEDLTESFILKLDEKLHLTLDDPLQEAYNCFSTLNQLSKDLHKHQQLNSKSEIVDKELVESIENMRKQQLKNNNL